MTNQQQVGIGLRSCHYDYILNNQPNIAWFEVLSDNYLVAGGPQLAYLDAIRRNYPVAMHGVGMSIGSTDDINWDYFKKIKRLANRINPIFISDHLSWVSIEDNYLHDLLPLPYIEEVINHVATRIQKIQEFLGVQILIENISSYFEYNINIMPKWEFINAVAEKADCFILLDINNLYVSAKNHQFDPDQYLLNINKKRVKQFHLAGYTDKGAYLFDTHSENIHEPVWLLYASALKILSDKPTLIEWDGKIPAFVTLLKEAQQAQKIIDLQHAA